MLHDRALQAELTVIRPKAVRASQHPRSSAASPLWRSGSLQPTTPGRRAVDSPDHSAPGPGAGTGTVCGNCGTSSTPLWRKDRASGEVCSGWLSWLFAQQLWLQLMPMFASAAVLTAKSLPWLHLKGSGLPACLGTACFSYSWHACAEASACRWMGPVNQRAGQSAWSLSGRVAHGLPCNQAVAQ